MSARLIPLEQASAGMVLAADLRDADGAVLLPAGATLSVASLASLRRRGIAACSVRDDVAAPAQASAAPVDASPVDAAALDATTMDAAVDAAQARLAQLFRRSAEVEATPLLLRLLSLHRGVAAT
ncbi:MAG TPA: hypothetical protein DCW29_13770 [Janthinobacterium sp.]|nr:hypothetical protein [Janthinobacterium sp.]